MKAAIYAGSFDPITNGHLDVLDRALKLFDKVIVAVGNNTDKKTLFTTEERVEMIKQAVKDKAHVTVASFTGLLVDFAKNKGATVIIRGLRAVSDYEAELQLTLMNRKLNPDIETVFVMARGMYCYLSASIIKEAAQSGADLDGMVPKFVEEKLKVKLKI